MNKKNPVVFVGAGPGHPDLITVAGRRALEEADLVVYAGSLVSPEMLTWCKPGAETVDSAGLDLDEIVEAMIKGRQGGRRVVRLHTGEPSLYGAVREQYRALDKAGVPFEVIPGVTAAFAASAALGMEYTLPEVCQTLILTRAAGRTPVPEKEDLAALAAHGASLAIYLSASQAAKVGPVLALAYGEQAPLVVAYRVSWPDQELFWTTPSGLARDLEEKGIKRQALILAGPGVTALQNGETKPSRLYDPTFSHGFRTAKDSGKKD